MSLIKIGDNNKLQMHDQLRDLGRIINDEEHHRSRLWDFDEALKVLKRNKGTKKIEAINLSEGSSKSFDETAKRHGNNYTSKQFKKLTSLRLLYMKGAHLSGDFEDSMEELKWLQWQNCPASFERNNFHVNELLVLELRRSEINEKWRGWSFFKMAEKLKYLDLTGCFSLEEDTDFLSAFKKLEVLILNYCYRLKRISTSIGDMEALLRLELGWCRSLTELPAEIGNLKALKQLNLGDTRLLSALPDSIWFLENLEILDISLIAIQELPNGIGRLRKLRELRASYCKLERIMAESMCDLSSLRCLDFISCYTLESLPDLPSGLTVLGITCQSHKLPLLSHLAHLKELRVCFCTSLECIQVLPSTPLKNSECSQSMDVEGLDSSQSLNIPFKLEILDVNHWIYQNSRRFTFYPSKDIIHQKLYEST
ncbi:hypothetical protein BT93_E2504 [Corymbia citriodora subsp. variegata]|nr:hypothetical protein BT93_E2504 [Corymbia citriodora subsp. variegata]